MALARIDSILFALVDENLGASRGGGRSQGGGPVGATMLSHEEVEAVIAYVDMDQSGEIDAEVGAFLCNPYMLENTLVKRPTNKGQ